MSNCTHEMVEYVGLTDRFMNCKLCGAKESEIKPFVNHVSDMYSKALAGLPQVYVGCIGGSFSKTRDAYLEAQQVRLRCMQIKLEEPPKQEPLTALAAWLLTPECRNHRGVQLPVCGPPPMCDCSLLMSQKMELKRRITDGKPQGIDSLAALKFKESAERGSEPVSLLITEVSFHEAVKSALNNTVGSPHRDFSDRLLAELRAADEDENDEE